MGLCHYSEAPEEFIHALPLGFRCATAAATGRIRGMLRLVDQVCVRRFQGATKLAILCL